LPTDTNRTNLGLYGGLSFDLTYSAGGRLFAAVITPTSLYYSDDTATSWYHAFPNDSLLFDCETRGWGGQADKVLANTKGWVAVQTSMLTDHIASSVISFSEGDSATWKTAMDLYLLNQYGYSANKIGGIALSDYFLYTALGYVITLSDTSIFNPSTDIIDITLLITGIDTTADIISIAAANSNTGFPFYIIADTSGINGNTDGLLYKYNGISFSQISIPSDIVSLTKVFTHPLNSLGDTLFISGESNLNQNVVYRSFDGGLNWTDVTFWAGTLGNYELTDVDYSAEWKLSAPSGDGIILNCKGVYISKNLGDTWETAGMPSGGLAIHPMNIDFAAKSFDRIIKISNSGVSAAFIDRFNEGLDATFIYKIASTNSKGACYLATNSGLAYTTEYTNNTIDPFQKWQSPNGEFPLGSIPLSSGEVLKTVAINPSDSLNVITGSTKGFYVSQAGPGVFTWIVPSGWDGMQLNDIEFINSQLVIAVTGGDVFNTYGNIWRSTDKGTSWSNVSPYNFNCGNTIAVGYGKTDTVIYAGTGVAGKKAGILWKSNDLGLSWTNVNAGPKDYPNFSVDSLPIVDIEIDPRGRDTLYIAAAGIEDETSIVRSANGGNSYQYINTAVLAADNIKASAILIHQEFPDSVYLAIGRYIGVYDFPTDSFQYLFSSFPGEIIHDLSYGSILAGTTTGFYILNIETYDDLVDIATISLQKNEIKVFPNPATDDITIETKTFSYNQQYNTLKISDAMGRELFTSKLLFNQNNNKISLAIEHLPAGLYFVEIENLSKPAIFIKE
jgi:hypothetical protein